MPEIYADWKSLQPLTAPVPVGTKCVVIRQEIHAFSPGAIVVTKHRSRTPACGNGDLLQFVPIYELALLPADYQATPELAEQPAPTKPERKVVHGFCDTEGYVHAVCDDGSMWYLGRDQEPVWRKLPPIPQD